MKTMITALLLLTSTAFAGGGGSQPTYISTCTNKAGNQLHLMFLESKNFGYFFRSSSPDINVASNWGTNFNGFNIKFRQPGFVADYFSASNPLITSDFKQSGTLIVKQASGQDVYRCLRQQ